MHFLKKILDQETEDVKYKQNIIYIRMMIKLLKIEMSQTEDWKNCYKELKNWMHKILNFRKRFMSKMMKMKISSKVLVTYKDCSIIKKMSSRI